MAPWAVVPVKDLTRAKRRLADLLVPEDRRGFYAAMLSDVLEAVTAVPSLAGVMVVTRDPEAAALAQRYGAQVLAEESNRGHSRAVARGAAQLRHRGIATMITLPGDVPLASAVEIETVLQELGPTPAMTLVPDRHGDGSNGLAVSPPDLIEFRFGPGSFPLHLEAARTAGVEARVLTLPGLGLDVDTADDLRAFAEAQGRAAGTHAGDYLRRHGIRSALAGIPSPSGPEPDELPRAAVRVEGPLP